MDFFIPDKLGHPSASGVVLLQNKQSVSMSAMFLGSTLIYIVIHDNPDFAFLRLLAGCCKGKQARDGSAQERRLYQMMVLSALSMLYKVILSCLLSGPE